MDSSQRKMVVIAVLWVRKSVWYTDDEINSQLHWMLRVKLLIGGSLVPQCCKHGSSGFIGRAGRACIGEGLKSNHGLCREHRSRNRDKDRCRRRGGSGYRPRRPG